jgi:uncharacterized RDD family membrane protein YckC
VTEAPPPPPQDPGAYPPPPPGAYPPPPPGAYPPPPGPAAGQLPGGNFETWLKRVGAYLIDSILLGIIVGIGYAIAIGTADKGLEEISYGDPYKGGGVTYADATIAYSGVGVAALTIFGAAGIAFWIWNWGYKQGTTGSSIGKNLLGLKVLGIATGQPIGFGLSVVRQIAHILDGFICNLGYLLPLFTAKRQTIADLLLKTVVVPVQK